MAQCPFITPPEQIEDTFNTVLNYRDLGGCQDYIFFDHDDMQGTLTRVQFCQYIGRKLDPFQCMNPGEWKHCYVYLNHQEA